MDRNELREIAENNWYLDKLYEALSQAKQQLNPTISRKLYITPIEKDYLYGVLERKSPQQLAEIYGKKSDVIRVQLSKGLYRYFKRIFRYAQSENIQSIDIPEELAKLKYKKVFSEVLPEKVWWQIALDFDINEISLLQTIINKLRKILGKPTLKIQKIEPGSVLIIWESLPEEFAQIARLFRSGQLTDLLGVQVKDLIEINPNGNSQYWRHLFPNIYEENYQPVAMVLAPIRGRGIHSANAEDSAEIEERVKSFELGFDQSIDLVIQLIPKDEEIGINIWIYPSSDALYLPVGLQVTLLDELGVPVPNLQAQADDTDQSIKLPFSVETGEKFSVRLNLGDVTITEHF
jgi:hypothetical protein